MTQSHSVPCASDNCCHSNPVVNDRMKENGEKYNAFLDVQKAKFDSLISLFREGKGLEEIKALDTPSRDDLGFLLTYVSFKDRRDLVRALIEKGADPNYSFIEEHFCEDVPYYQCPLRMCARNGNLELFKYLCDNGAKIDIGNRSMLRMACVGGNLEIVKRLLTAGMSIYGRHSPISCRYQELIQSIAHEQYHIAQFLLKQVELPEDVVRNTFIFFHDRRMFTQAKFVAMQTSNIFIFLIRLRSRLNSKDLSFWCNALRRHIGKCRFAYSYGAIRGNFCTKNTKNKYCRKHCK